MLIDVSNINYGLVADMETIDTNSLGVFNEMETIVLVSKFGQKHICWICGVHMPNYNYIAEAGLCADCRTNENVNALFVTQELPFQLGDIVTFSQRGKRLIVYDTQTRTGFSKTWSVHLRYIGSRKRKMINQRTPQEDYPVLVGHSLEEYVRNFDFWQLRTGWIRKIHWAPPLNNRKS